MVERQPIFPIHIQFPLLYEALKYFYDASLIRGMPSCGS
jgi:hypothetical protein